MILKSHIVKSNIPLDGPHGPHFNSAKIQAQLVTICNRWSEYLKEYVERTGDRDLFGKSELPWLNNG